MINQVYVIKSLKKGVWYYYYKDVERKMEWTPDLYFATHWNSYEEAESYFKNMVKVYHWGGYFQIDKYFVSR
jgi:hypothetical protein